METVIVSRHAGLVEYLEKKGIVGRVIPHATAADVKGKIVVGNLPLHLAALAAKVGSVDMNVPAEMRGQELSASQVSQYATGISWYVVRTETDQDFLLTESNLSGHQGGSALCATAMR
jgi:putative CRISPR-associated protein (TIGR02620 family)